MDSKSLSHTVGNASINIIVFIPKYRRRYCMGEYEMSER